MIYSVCASCFLVDQWFFALEILYPLLLLVRYDDIHNILLRAILQYLYTYNTKGFPSIQAKVSQLREV